MTNVFYQTAVQELEAVLSPRVVSRSLKEGLRQHGRSPETADLPVIEEILKAQVYRQLQVTMPVTEAKTAVNNIVERLRELDPSGGQPSTGEAGGLVAQAERLERLQTALKPFNLYFEWPEVQKLRAQVQLLEAEHESGREANALGEDAESQLELVMQKLEDQLVLQARELGELREALEAVRTLGGPKVRRLETFVHQLAAAQDARQLAPAEIERARRLARDLRKLMESSVYTEQLEAGAQQEPAPERPPSPFSIHPSAGEVSEPDPELSALMEHPPLREAGEPTDARLGVDEFGAGVGGAQTPADGSLTERLAEPPGEPPARPFGQSAEEPFDAPPGEQLAAGAEEAAGQILVPEDEGAEAAGTYQSSTADGSPAHADDLEGVIDVEGEEEELLSIDSGQLDPELSQRLRLLDLASELHDIAQLENDHAELFNYQPALAANLAELRAEVEADRSVAEVLEGLQHDLEAATSALRDDLREELEEISASLAGVRPEIDSSELSQAVRVTLGILSTSLPSLADVEHVRRLHRLLREQEEAIERSEAALAAQLHSQDELLARLEGTLVRYEAAQTATEDVQQLREELESLRLAQENRTLVPEVMASARQVEERIARALAERATEASERRRARLEALRAQLESLPVTQTLSERADGARREIDRLLDEQLGSEAAGALLLDDADEPFGPELSLTGDEADLAALDSLLEGLKTEARSSIHRRLQALADEAGEIGSTRLADRLQAALADLEDGRFPDLAHLEAAVEQEREAARLEQVGELHRLTRAFAPYQGLDDERARELAQLLGQQKRKLDNGEPASQLETAATLFAELEQEAAQRVSTMPQRLDAALSRFEAVAKLNSEDVASARRILSHLDSQRGSLERVSVGLRLQLESSLTQAESLLDSLEEEYEATRVIAEELVSEGLLDGVLGLFGEAGEPAQQAATPAFDAAQLCARYAEVPGVEAVSVFGQGGEVLAASSEVDDATAQERVARLRALRGAGLDLVADPSQGVHLASFEAGGSYLVAGFAASGEAVLLHLDSSALVPVMIGRLRRDLSELDG